MWQNSWGFTLFFFCNNSDARPSEPYLINNCFFVLSMKTCFSDLCSIIVCLIAVLLSTYFVGILGVALDYNTPLHPYMLGVGETTETRVATGPMYFFLSSLPLPPPSHHGSVWLLPVISLVLTYTESAVRTCLSIWLERFRGSQKEDERGPLSIQSSLAWGICQPLTSKQAKPSLHIHPSTIQAAIWFPYFVIRFLCHTLSSQLYNCRSQYSYCLHVNLATRLSFKLLQEVNTSVHPQNLTFCGCTNTSPTS